MPPPRQNPPEPARIDFTGRILIGLEGEALSENDRRRLAHPAVAGAILFARNFRSARQLRQLAANARRAKSIPLLLAADHEGGRVQRFGPPDFTPLPPMRQIPSDNAARDCGIVAAAELLAAGLDLSFAPVADLDFANSAVIGNRAFSPNPQIAAHRILAFAKGAQAAGMHSCAKHFPGHGFAAADSHAETPNDPRPLPQIRDADLLPFEKWANARMPAVMTAHVAYPQCAPEPATFSEFWLKKILRNELQFDGIIIGDDLAMHGANIGGIGDRMKKSLRAGCDALMICEPDMIDDALAFADNQKGETGENPESPWLKLAAKPDGRITVADAEYEQARENIITQWR